jgi:hypothetical protein
MPKHELPQTEQKQNPSYAFKSFEKFEGSIKSGSKNKIMVGHVKRIRSM